MGLSPLTFGRRGMEEEIILSILQYWRKFCKSRGNGWNAITTHEPFLCECNKRAKRAVWVQRKRFDFEASLSRIANRERSDLFGDLTERNPLWNGLDKLLEKYERPEIKYEDSTVHQLQNGIVEAKQLARKSLQPNKQQPLLDLMILADVVKLKVNRKVDAVGKRLVEQHYISTGIDEDPLFSSMYNGPSYEQKRSDAASPDLSFVNALDDVSNIDKEDVSHSLRDKYAAIPDTTILLDSIASTAKFNLREMKQEVNDSLVNERGSHIQLGNYKNFIQKKKRHRIQCLRDLEEHCCTCRGPHIAKPPFTHGENYRQEPTHKHYQYKKCSFITKKRKELVWLEKTIDKYGSNQERFEMRILKCQDETERRKNCLKETLANNLRLMELAN